MVDSDVYHHDPDSGRTTVGAMTFTDDRLANLRLIHDAGGGPRAAYRYWYGLSADTGWYRTESVEDFIIAFYTAYNQRFGRTY
jgi:hypothetical protein